MPYLIPHCRAVLHVAARRTCLRVLSPRKEKNPILASRINLDQLAGPHESQGLPANMNVRAERILRWTQSEAQSWTQLAQFSQIIPSGSLTVWYTKNTSGWNKLINMYTKSSSAKTFSFPSFPKLSPDSDGIMIRICNHQDTVRKSSTVHHAICVTWIKQKQE